MLSSTETIHVIAEALESHKVPAVVLDPVYTFTLWFFEFPGIMC